MFFQYILFHHQLLKNNINVAKLASQKNYKKRNTKILEASHIIFFRTTLNEQIDRAGNVTIFRDGVT